MYKHVLLPSDRAIKLCPLHVLHRNITPIPTELAFDHPRSEMQGQGSELWCLMPLSTIFQLYQWRSVLLVEETKVPGENHRPATSHCRNLSHNVVSSTLSLSGIRTQNISGDRHLLHSYKCNYHMIRAMTSPLRNASNIMRY